MIKEILRGTSVAWSGATLLGLLFAACSSGHFSFASLRLPGVVQIALLISAGIAVLMAPLVMWAFKPEGTILIVYGSALFVLLAVYIVITAPFPPFGLYGSVLLACTGLVIIGWINRNKAQIK